MVRTCITFAGPRVDQFLAIEVLEALPPLGAQAAIEALDYIGARSSEGRANEASAHGASTRGFAYPTGRRDVWGDFLDRIAYTKRHNDARSDGHDRADVHFVRAARIRNL